MTNKSFDDILNNRFVPPPSTNLSERIIAAASMRQDKSFWQILGEELLDMFVLPQPAYAMAFCVILGLALGAQVPLDYMVYEPDYFSFLTFDEGDWL